MNSTCAYSLGAALPRENTKNPTAPAKTSTPADTTNHTDPAPSLAVIHTSK
jgi:hypothetical protein